MGGIMLFLRNIFLSLVLLVAPFVVNAEDQVNINTADVQTLTAELKGVGEKKAQAIIDYRDEHGPFRSASDLTSVKGVGDKLLEDNADKIIVEGE